MWELLANAREQAYCGHFFCLDLANEHKVGVYVRSRKMIANESLFKWLYFKLQKPQVIKTFFLIGECASLLSYP